MKKSLFIALTSALLAIVFCFAACNGDQTTGKTDPKPDEPKPVAVETLAITPTALTANTAAASAATKTLTVTVEPENAEYEIEWSAAFKNPDSTWATGRNVYDFIEITANNEIGSSANVKATRGFGEQIIITAAVKNSDVKATCVCDYRKQIKTFDLVFSADRVYNNFSITSANNFLTAEQTNTAGPFPYFYLTNFVYTPGTIDPTTNPTITNTQLVVDSATFKEYLSSLFSGSTNPLIESAIDGTHDLYTLDGGVYIYKNLNSLYTLFTLVCGEVTEKTASYIEEVAAKMNEDLKSSVSEDGKYLPVAIPGITFKYTLDSTTTSERAYYTAPVKYVYNKNFGA